MSTTERVAKQSFGIEWEQEQYAAYGNDTQQLLHVHRKAVRQALAGFVGKKRALVVTLEEFKQEGISAKVRSHHA